MPTKVGREDMMKEFWTTPKKIIFVILLAVAVSWIFGCGHPPDKMVVECAQQPPVLFVDADVPYAQNFYSAYNEQYFGNRLPRDTQINFELEDNNIADSRCENDDGTNCTIRFNPHYAAAGRTVQTILLHEMCHIKLWKTHLLRNKPPLADFIIYAHDRSWRACMLTVDTQGAFRQINIDYYDGDR